MPRGRPRKPTTRADNGVDEDHQSSVEIQRHVEHRCEICSQSFSSEAQIQKHLRDHKLNDKLYRCDQCPVSFNVEFNLELHKSTHTSSQPDCPVCHKKFSRVASLKAHISLHQKEENFLCAECGDEFVLQSQLSFHLEEHRQELSGKSFTCRSCSKEFLSPSQLKEHARNHGKHRPIARNARTHTSIDRRGFKNICHHCGKTFKKPSQLVRHVRIHTGERPYKCSYCDKSFNQKVVLQTHMVRHTGEKPHMCLLCPASFSQKGNLHSHVQRVHSQPSGAQVFPCMDCSCVYKKLGSLNAHISKMHISVMEVEEPATQKADGKVFQGVAGSEGSEGPEVVTDVIQQLLELSDHVTADTVQATPPAPAIDAINQDILQQALENSGLSEIPVQPDAHRQKTDALVLSDGAVASKVLMTDTALKREKRSIVKKPPQILGNLRQDNGVRWHGCQYCSKEFKKPSDLVRHIRIHTHEKPYKCKQCFRAFAVKSTLTAHMKIHSGIKAFVCHFCMKCFSTSGSMKVHQRLHTGVRPFPCPHCDKFFRTSGHRKTHIACHFKSLHQKKNKYPRKLHKSRASRSNISLADIPLQEPILITDIGLLQNQTTRAALQQYLDIVECQSERQYKCGFCNKSYKKSSHLKQHVRSHTGERPYKCLQCSKGFASSGVLKAHIRTHSGLKAFKCLMCDTSFTTSGSLRRHMTTHSDMRPYMCPYCQKTFKSSPNCRKHMKTHRYELAQQQQQQGLSDLQPSASVVDPKTQSILEVGSDGQQDGLPAPLGEDDLQETESFVSAQHVLPPHLNQFETPTIAQPTYEQPALTQAFSLADGFSQQSFSTVQQLQDSSTLESQSLTSSFHTPNILHVTDSEASGLLQETSQDELQLSMQTQDFHDEEENDKRVYPCNLCEKSFKKSSHLKQHVRSHTGEKPYRCNICGKSFVAAGVLKSHLNTHTGVKAFRCNVCHTSFTTNGSLNRHLAIHQDSKLKCGVCQETFRTLLMRRRHMRHHHAAASRALDEADETGEEAERPAAKRNRGSIIVLTEEQTAELAKRPPQDQSSVSERVLVQTAAERDRVSQVKEKCHALALEPKYGNSCQYCPKSFKKPSDLVRHIRTHTGEKPYKCDECEKTFTVKSTLDCHVKTHLGQKLFTCHMCHTSFSTKGSLKVHMRLHTGSKPFKCSMCDLSFRTSGHRKTHIQGHSRPSERKGQRGAKAEQDVQSFHAAADPSIFISGSPVLGHCEGLVGQAILPATMSANGDLTVSLSDSLTTLDGIQLVCPNLQISGIDTSSINNITLQFDPNVLQQTLQQSSLLSHSLTSDPMTPADPPGSANVVLHPLAGLALPPSIPVSVAVANLTGEQENAAVDCGGGAPEITLTINNSSLSEALVQNSATTSTPASGSPEITLTIAGSGVGELLAPCSSSSNMEVGTQEASATPSSQNMVMSSASLASDGSVTLTIADPLSAAPHSLEAEKHQCYYCSHVLLTANALRRHCRLVHGKERCHVCRLCNKGFKRATHLKEHEYVHKKGPKVNPQKPKVFKCPNCDKAFAKPSQLERHNRTHTGERPFRCPVCERAFNQKSALQVHRVKHTGEKPYRCEVCTISFTQKCNMKLHMKRSHGLATANHTHTAASVTRDVDLGNDSESAEMDTPTDWPCPITFPPPSAM